MTRPAPLLRLVRAGEIPACMAVEPEEPAKPGPQYDLGQCGTGYCDNPAIAYVVRRHHAEGRVIVIPGKRAQELCAGPGGDPLALRCIDCAHHEVDIALGLAPAEGQDEEPSCG